jgi:hypothetical protein
MQSIFYYVEESAQIKAFVELVGEYFEKLNHCQLWDLNMVLSYDLGQYRLMSACPDRLSGLTITHSEVLELDEDELIEQALKILEAIPRKQAKQVVLAIGAIAAESDHY